jgi:hypothetical protein
MSVLGGGRGWGSCCLAVATCSWQDAKEVWMHSHQALLLPELPSGYPNESELTMDLPEPPL